MAFKLDANALSSARLKKVEVNEATGAAQKTDISIYAEIYNECDGDFDKIAEKLSNGKDPIAWKDGIDSSSFSTFFKDPEKLFQVAFSANIFFTVAFDKHVKLPNLIDCPVNAKVRNL